MGLRLGFYALIFIVGFVTAGLGIISQGSWGQGTGQASPVASSGQGTGQVSAVASSGQETGQAWAVAATDASSALAEAGELVQIGPVTYANWGLRDYGSRTTRGLDAGDFYFKGTFIRGEPGQKLTLEIQNVADQIHNFSIPAQGVDRGLPRDGPRVNVAVTFPDSGEVQFFCKYHAAQGMNGLLLVGEVPPLSVSGPSPASSPQPAR